MVIHTHPALQRFNEGQAQLAMPDCTIEQLLPQLKQHAPLLARCILDDHGRIQPYVALFINNQRLSDFSTDYLLSNEDRIDLLSSLVGG